MTDPIDELSAQEGHAAAKSRSRSTHSGAEQKAADAIEEEFADRQAAQLGHDGDGGYGGGGTGNGHDNGNGNDGGGYDDWDEDDDDRDADRETAIRFWNLDRALHGDRDRIIAPPSDTTAPNTSRCSNTIVLSFSFRRSVTDKNPPFTRWNL